MFAVVFARTVAMVFAGRDGEIRNEVYLSLLSFILARQGFASLVLTT
jgi:hypothetical protein